MLKRKIEKKLIAWKNTENRKPLIIKGCRQCGKTFSVLDFAKKNYKNVVYWQSPQILFTNAVVFKPANSEAVCIR